MNVLQYNPGATVTVIFQTLGTDGYREDGYHLPFVARVILPDLTESTLYPLPMVRIDTGLYYHKFQLPTQASSIGSYIVDITYYDAIGGIREDLTQIICSTSGSGSFSVSPN